MSVERSADRGGDRLADLARFAAAAERAAAETWPAVAAAFAQRHGVPVARETLRFLSLFFGLPRTLRALDRAAEVLAAAGEPDERNLAPGSEAERGRTRFAAVYGADAAPVLDRLAFLDPHLRDWILGHAYGRVHAGGGLSLVERERLAVMALAAAECWKQCDSHVRACLRLGVTAPQLQQDAAAGAWLTAEQTARLRTRIADLTA
jgi:alkylhydroperoxidase/carboxymuconolactone decarboxylase family protein YurZ